MTKQAAGKRTTKSRSVKQVGNKAVVVGAGAGGLASALLLQHAGYQTTILEKNNFIGGKLSAEKLGDYTFDSGPSILTLPNIIRELFRATGADLADYLELVELDPQWRCFFPDGLSFDFRAGEERMCEEIRKFAPKEVENFRKLCERTNELYKVSQDNFFFRDYGSVMDVMLDQRSSLWNGLRLVKSISPSQTYSQVIDQYIKEPHLRQALEHLPQYIGSSPFQAPAILGCLVHVQFDRGCWYPMGGMGAISQALVRRFSELGGKIELGCSVTRAYHDGKTLRGIESEDGTLWEASEYVINADANSFAPLIDEKPIADDKLACSGITIFLGLKKKLPQLAHHNFFFSRSHRDEFKDMYERGVPSNDPTIYACVPSKTDPTVAPKDRENIFLLIHTAIDKGDVDWSTFMPGYSQLLKSKLAQMGLGIQPEDIEVEAVKTPTDIGARWGTYKGNIYGQASHGRLQGAFKKRNQSRFGNLQFAGGTVNPGAGVPMSVMSGMTASANILRKRVGFSDLQL